MKFAERPVPIYSRELAREVAWKILVPTNRGTELPSLKKRFTPGAEDAEGRSN